MPGLTRRVVFWLHLTSGLAVGAVVLVMSVTGVALTYQRQLQYWADTRTFRADDAGRPQRLPAEDLLGAARSFDPGGALTGVTFRADPSQPVAVALASRTVYVDPYTAAVHGEGRGQALRRAFNTIVAWHRHLGRGPEGRAAGRAVTGATNLTFFLLVLSGLYLWWPRSLRWRSLRQVVWFRRGLPARARDFNWHNTLGFWAAVPLVAVVGSGVVISYPWATDLVYRAVGEEPPRQAARRTEPTGSPDRRDPMSAPTMLTGATPLPDIDQLLAHVAREHSGWQVLTVRLPTPSGAPVTLTVDSGDGGQPQLRTLLSIDAHSGRIDRVEAFGDQTPGRRLRALLRFTHTGEVLGWAGQTVAGLASAVAAVLVCTGISLSARRVASWRRRFTPVGPRTAAAAPLPDRG